MKNVILETKNIYKFYNEDLQTNCILNNINLTIYKNEMIAIIGSSGSGKSTLLHILGLLAKPSSGSVIINGMDSNNISERERCSIRNHSLGFIYQFHHLLPEFSALDNVAMPLIIQRKNRSLSRSIAYGMLELVGLGKYAKRFPDQLSGGECQRIALARALINKPICLLADEPTGNLDQATAFHIFDIFNEINHEFGTAIAIVTHDHKLSNIMNRELLIKNGKLFLKTNK